MSDSLEIRILFLSANPRDLRQGVGLALDEECRSIDQALRTGDFREQFHFVSCPAVRANEIQELLLRHRPHIVHFSGHGSEASELIFVNDSGESQPVQPDILEQLFSVLKDNLRCVVLNACYSDQQAQAVANHVDCVVGMAGAFPDESARAFAIGFYRALAFGRDMRSAYELGKLEAENAIPDSGALPKLLAQRVDPSNVILVLTDAVQRARTKQLEELTVPISELDRNLHTCHPPSRVRPDDYLPNSSRMLWIIGPPGIGKRTLALYLARKVVGHSDSQPPFKSIYSVPRFESWTRLEELNLHDAVILLPDTLGTVVFERDQIEKELRSLTRLIDNQNVVVATSPEDVYEEALETMPRLSEAILNRGKILEIGADDYQHSDKEKIYQKLLQYAHTSGLLEDSTYRYGEILLSGVTNMPRERSSVLIQARALFGKRLRETWLPIDLDRFVFTSLSTVRNEHDLLLQLQRDADIEHRVQTWFLELDENTRCFLLTLNVFLGSKEHDLWIKHRAIVERLHVLNSSLCLIPLGILRHQAAPYVTENGALDFINPSVYRALTKVIISNYQEYLAEILPLLKEWSVPESPTLLNSDREVSEEVARQHRREAWDKVIQATEADRNAIARFVGEAAKHGIDNVLEILNAWAGHHRDPVAKTAGIALRETATDPIAVRHVLNLLHEWATDFRPNEGRYYRWSASSALWRIGIIKTRRDLQEAATKYLHMLARDSDEYVRASVIYAAGKLVGPIRPVQLKSLVDRLALGHWRDKGELAAAQMRMLQVIERVANLDPQQAAIWIEPWLDADSDFARWCAMAALLYCRGLPDTDRYRSLLYAARTQPQGFLAVLMALLDSGENQRIRPVLNVLTAEGSQGYRQALTDAFLQASGDPEIDMQEVRNFIGALEDQRFSGVLQDMDTQTWIARTSEMLQTSASELLDWIEEMFEKSEVMAWKVLIQIAQPEPTGLRQQLVAILVDGAYQVPEKYHILTARLSAYSDDSVATIPAEVENMNLNLWVDKTSGLLQSSSIQLMTWIEGMFEKSEVMAWKVLVQITQPEPTGYYRQLITILADGANQNREKYRILITKLRDYSEHSVTQPLTESDHRVVNLPTEVEKTRHNLWVDHTFAWTETLGAGVSDFIKSFWKH